MIRYISKLVCIALVLILPIKAMGPQVEDIQENNQIQEQRQAKDPKSLVVQALLKVARSPQITDEQIEQLPQEVKKVARLLRSVGGDATKALHKAIKVRGDLLEVAHRLQRLQHNNIQVNLDTESLMEQSYSLEEIRMLIKCGAVIGDSVSDKARNALTQAIAIGDAELVKLLVDEKASIKLLGRNNLLTVWLARTMEDLRFGCRKLDAYLAIAETLINAGVDISCDTGNDNLLISYVTSEQQNLNSINVHGFDKPLEKLRIFLEEQIAKKRQLTESTENLTE